MLQLYKPRHEALKAKVFYVEEKLGVDNITTSCPVWNELFPIELFIKC